MIPITMRNDDELEEPKRLNQPFMRGIMEFDDYNYKNLNEYVLIEEPKDLNRRKLDLKERTEIRSQQSNEIASNRLTQLTMLDLD